MRPILFSIGDLYVFSYPVFVLLAVLIGLAGVLWRTRERAIALHVLASAIVWAILAGWVTGRAFLLLGADSSELGWAVFSPLEPAPSSFTHFAIGASVALLAFALVRRRDGMAYLDALAPSSLLGLGIAKFGCLFAGCCGGTVCPPSLGITYPYGSDVHKNQFVAGQLKLPSELIRPQEPPGNIPGLWGHLQLLEARPDALSRELQRAGPKNVSPEAVLSMAREHRSLPVWPLPVYFGAAALGLAVGAEWTYRRSVTPGVTLAFTLASVGLLRLVFDSLLAHRGHLYAGMTVPQWVGAAALLLAVAIYVLVRKTSRSAGQSVADPPRSE